MHRLDVIEALRHPSKYFASVKQTLAVTTTPTCAGEHGGPPLRRGFVYTARSTTVLEKRDDA